MSPPIEPSRVSSNVPESMGDVAADEAMRTSALSPAEERFERLRRRTGMVLAPLAFIVAYLVASGLPTEGRTLSAILAAVATLWVCETLPLPVTALFGAAACVVLGVAPARQVLAYFADPIVFVFIGGFMLARAMTVHALDRRIALTFLSVPFFNASPSRMLAGLGAVTAFLSMWISNTASTAMMLPIALGVLGALHASRVRAGLASGPMDARHWPFATGMMLMVAYSASLGGVGTPVGSPPNLIGIAQIRASAGRDIGFFEWTAVAVPIMVVAGVALFAFLNLLHPAPKDGTQRRGADAPTTGGSMRDFVESERAHLGGWTAGQRGTLVAFCVAVTLWVLPGLMQAFSAATNTVALLPAQQWFEQRLPEGVVAIVAAVLLFAIPINCDRAVLAWDDAAKIDWGTILLFGGGLALGGLMFTTGVAEAIGRGLTSTLGVESLWSLTAMSIVIAIVMSETASNTAAATMIIPVVIAVAHGAGVSPVPPALGACLGASYGFMLPVSTPPNAIVYGSGLVPLPRMIRAGAVFDMVGFVVIFAGLRVLCPLLGLM